VCIKLELCDCMCDSLKTSESNLYGVLLMYSQSIVCYFKTIIVCVMSIRYMISDCTKYHPCVCVFEIFKPPTLHAWHAVQTCSVFCCQLLDLDSLKTKYRYTKSVKAQQSVCMYIFSCRSGVVNLCYLYNQGCDTPFFSVTALNRWRLCPQFGEAHDRLAVLIVLN